VGDGLSDRVARLERELARAHADRADAERRARRRGGWLLGLACVLGAGALLAAAAPESFAVVRTKRLEIVDDQNRVLALLAAGPDGGQLDLWASTGMNAARVGATKAGGDLSIWNVQGKPALGAFVADAGGIVETYDNNGRMQTRVSSARGGGQLILQNSFGKPGVLAMAEDRGGGIAACDPAGRPLVELSVTDSGGLALVANRAGRTVGALRTNERGGALEIADSNGARAFSAGADVDGGSWSLSTPDGRTAVVAACRGSGAGTFIVNNSDQKPAVTIGSTDEAAGRVAVAGPEGQTQVLVQGSPNGGGMQVLFAGRRVLLVEGNAGGGRIDLADSDGRSAAALGVDLTTQSGAVSVRNQNAQELIRIGADDKGNGAVTVTNQAGTERRNFGVREAR
jgi:hypothetical protein